MASRPESDFDLAVAAYIRAVADEKHMGQEETAGRAGIPVNTFRRYWRGERAPKSSDLRLIFEVLGVSFPDAWREIDRIFVSGEYKL